MPKIRLAISQSLEVFSRIITRMEAAGNQEVQLSDFYEQSYLNGKLKNYDSRKLCAVVSNTIFGTRTDDNGHVVANYPAGFYEFGRKIRLGEPVILEEEMLDAMLGFINKAIAKTSPDYFSIGYRNYITPTLPKEKQYQFQQTQWWLYFYDRRYHHDGYEDGITKALLRFLPFGKAEIKSYSPNREGHEEYVGEFEMYGEAQKQILMEMKLKKTFEKDLHILLYIGTDEISLALGQFHNIGRSIYSGTVVMERIEEERPDETLINFYNPGQASTGNIPAYVRQYFLDRKRNIIRTPRTITNQKEFERWLYIKNN